MRRSRAAEALAVAQGPRRNPGGFPPDGSQWKSLPVTPRLRAKSGRVANADLKMENHNFVFLKTSCSINNVYSNQML